LVWEYGNVRQTKKGPKTTLAIDIETGRKVWLTIQAPHGYVRILTPKFHKIIRIELGKVKFGEKNVKKQVIEAWERIGELCAIEVRKVVPVDKGNLKESITWLKPRAISDLKALLKDMRGS